MDIDTNAICVVSVLAGNKTGNLLRLCVQRYFIPFGIPKTMILPQNFNHNTLFTLKLRGK
jgi:hypothetical protein